MRSDPLVEEVWVHDNANRGVFAQNDYGPASVTVRRSLVARNGLSGVLAGGSGMTIEATVVRDNLRDAEGYRGRGIVAQVFEPTGARANVSIVRSLVQGNHVDGIWITGAEVMVEATVVRDTLTDVDNVAGRGILAQDNEVTRARADVTVARSVIERNHDAGVAIMGSTASVEATVVRSTLQSASEFHKGGIMAIGNAVTASRASLAVARCLLERNSDFGIAVDGSDATVEATAIRDPAVEQGGFGRAIQIQRDSNTGSSASAILRANFFERSVRSGVGVMGPATAELEACLVVDTAAADGDYLGDGLTVWSYDGPASATLTATRIERSHRAAVSSFGGAVAIEGSQFVCQAFDLAAESLDGVAAVYDDRGGVLCGCPEATESCKAQSYALEPPTLE